jgi:membrane-associated phospholipid phosphatase
MGKGDNEGPYLCAIMFRQVNKWFFVPVFLALALGFWWASRVDYGDELAFFNTWKMGATNALFRLWSASAEGWVYVPVILYLLYRKHYRAGVLLALATASAMPLSQASKGVYGTARPERWLGEMNRLADVVFVEHVDMNGGYNSFPSGHTMSAFAFYTLCTLLFLKGRRRPWGLPLAVLAVGVGISRIYLVQHFLIDVLGGACIGLVVALLFYGVYVLLVKNNRKNNA